MRYGTAAVRETEKAYKDGEVNVMDNFILENGTKTFFGRGCVKEYLGCLVKSYGENVMFAYGEGSVKRNGVYQHVMESLEKAGKNVIEFSGISPNPSYEKVLEGARLARENRVHLVIGAGGGSVMDCCKAISMATVYDGDLWTDFYERPDIVHFDPLPLGVVVTTAGSGSEMNGAAVITNQVLKVKTGRDYPKCNPKFALMDPSYTASVPLEQMASGGFDMLSYMMETYFGWPDEDNVSDDLVETLMRGVIRNLRRAVADPGDYVSGSNLMWTSAIAKSRLLRLGKRADCQLCRMGNQLSAYTGCSYGAGLAVLQPVFYRYIYRENIPKFQRFAAHVWEILPEGKTEEELALAGVEALEGFIRELGLPATLRELGADESLDLEALAGSGVVTCCSCRQMSREEILGILRACY